MMQHKPRPQTNDIKGLLHGSSPKNPTYILAVVLADFNSQGFTEISVKKGDEIYVMYELDDWAYVACLTETSRRGYIPLDYCLPVEDFFYDNPSLNRAIKNGASPRVASTELSRQPLPVKYNTISRIPATSHQSKIKKSDLLYEPRHSLRSLQPAEGSEKPASLTERQRNYNVRGYHSTDNLIATIPDTPPHQLANDMRGRGMQLRRSNTTVATMSKPLVRPNKQLNAKCQTVSNGIATKSFFNSPTKPTITNTYFAPISSSSETKSSMRPANTSNGAQRRTWGLHIKPDLGEHSKKLSLSLETVEETSEFEESLNISHEPLNNGGIHRLIARFQTKILEQSDVEKTTPRLSSADSALSSLSEDNDSVFTDNEEHAHGIKAKSIELVQREDNSENLKPTVAKQANGEVGKEIFTKGCEPVQKSEKGENATHDELTNTFQVLTQQAVAEDTDALSKSSEDTLDLESLEQLDSSLLCEGGEPFLGDSLLEPPLSFSSPSLSSESAIDVTAETRQHGHCSCCIHYRQAAQTNGQSYLAKWSNEPVLANGNHHRDLLSSSEDGRCSSAQTDADSQSNAELSKTEICDSVSQTSDSFEDLTATTARKKNGVSRQSTSFSRNAKLRQSRLCAETAENCYLMQPISPASLTDDKLPEIALINGAREPEEYGVLL